MMGMTHKGKGGFSHVILKNDSVVLKNNLNILQNIFIISQNNL